MVQLTDTHIVAAGERYLNVDTAAYLADAVEAVNRLRPAPDYVVVTGDLVNTGRPEEYARFVRLIDALAAPYFAVPGNHDARETFRAGLPPSVYGDARGERIRFVVDRFPLRLIGLDANVPRPWVAPELDRASLDWLETTLANGRERPTLLTVHQPPFRTGMHYFDVFGYRGARRLRRIVSAAPQVGRVITGHIHCVKTYRWGATLVASAPSTAPQMIPELFEHRILGIRHEVPGFTVHDWTAETGFSSRVYRRDGSDAYVAEPPLPVATRR